MTRGALAILVVVGMVACVGKRGEDDFVYFRTVPMTAAGADSLGGVLLAQHLGASHVAAFGPERVAPRRGMVAFEGDTTNASRERVIVWLRQRREVVNVGMNKEAAWSAPNAVPR